MRTAGLSGSKAAAVTDLARKVEDGTVPLADVDSLSDDDLIARLVQAPGIGPWPAHMFLMFQLRRRDVRPVEDYGVRKPRHTAHRPKQTIKPVALPDERDRLR